MGKKNETHSLSELLRVTPGTVDVSLIDTDAAPGYAGEGKDDAESARQSLVSVIGDLQERLFATGRSNPATAPRVLVVLQGLDTAGKGGVMRHAASLVDPQGLRHKAFKAPTPEELAHPYLWRIENALPEVGMIGFFDRSHYEDVLVVRVENLVSEDIWSRRYDEINAWEKGLVDQGFVIIKCFLHVGKDEQRRRLLERVENPDKYWKYNPKDLQTRAKWDAYADAYNAVLNQCSTEHAPWHVIPADKKWYKDWAVAELLREKLAALDLAWPDPAFDVQAEFVRITES